MLLHQEIEVVETVLLELCHQLLPVICLKLDEQIRHVDLFQSPEQVQALLLVDLIAQVGGVVDEAGNELLELLICLRVQV